MERTPSPRNIELAGIADVLNEGRMASNLQLRIAHLEPQTLTIGKDTRVAALEFCVHGIVVHLRLGRDQRSSELTGNVFNPYWQGMCGPFGLFSVRVATSWAHIPRRVHPSSAVTLATFGRRYHLALDLESSSRMQASIAP